MPKIRIKVMFQNNKEKNSYETTAILDEDKLKYKEDDNTTIIWNYKENTLQRETKELRLKYSFQEKKKTEGILFIKEIGTEIIVPVETKKLERKNHNIDIIFQVEDNKVHYCVEEII